MRRKAALLGLAFLVSSCALANRVEFRLYINSGMYTAVDSATFPMSAFNLTPNFVAQNALILLEPGDTLALWILNNDSIDHGFQIDGHSTSQPIPAGDSIQVIEHFAQDDYATIYYDPLGNSNFRAAGLAGLIHVSNKQNHLFYWNMKEFEKALAPAIVSGQSVNWSSYYPDYFTINGRSNPHINTDSVARVIGVVGDEIQIVMANTGTSSHSIHFHGYHVEVIFSSANPTHVGRSKDTIPIKSMQTLILQLVPDKPGEYPVHDHNLSAVAAGGIYPNGMFLTMKIE